MASWKKVIVSGSVAELNNLYVTNSITASAYSGDGSALTGVSATGLNIDAFGSDHTSITIADTDKFAVSDAGTEGRINASQIATYVFGKASDSGDATIGADGGITINADSVALGTDTTGNYVKSLANATNGGTTIANGSAEGGDATVTLNLNDLSAATVDVAADSIAIIDANDSNGTRKESIADLVSGIAGSGLSATDGVLAISETGDIAGVTAGAGLSGGGTSGTVSLAIDISEFSAVTPANGDSFLTLDSDGSTEQLTTTTALATLLAGSNITATNSVLAVDDAFLINSGNDTTSGTITAAGFTTVGNISGSVSMAVQTGITTAANLVTVGTLAAGNATAIVDAASATAAGKVELATTAETTTGTDAARAVTPDGLKDGYQGSTNVTTLGTITTGTWNGSVIAHAYIGGDAIEEDNIADDAVESEHLNDNVISGQTDIGAAIASGDEILISDGGSLRRTDIDRVATLFAGAGLTDSSGVMAVGAGTGIDVAANAISVDVSDFMTNGSNNRIVTATGTDAQNAEDNLTFDGSTLDVTGDITVSGNLDVNGTLTTIDTTNLAIKDQFITIASGSQSAADGGIVVSKQADGAGFALGYDTATTRWAFDNDLGVTATGLTPDSYVGIVTFDSNAATGDPTYGGSSNGYGAIHVETDTGDIFIYS